MSTAPINISMSSIKGKCDQFCLYSSKYTPTSSIATNQGSYISLTYDNGSTNPVMYNKQSYVVDQMRVYFPSLHSYGGKQMVGEFVIIHTPVMGGDALLVCIPIKPTGVQSSSAMMLAKIIQTVSSKAPNSGETVQVFSNLDLSKMIPKAPFFSYSGTLPYQPYTGNVNYVVFNVSSGAFDIDPNVLNRLKDVITPQANPIITRTTGDHSGNVFYNKTGPTSMSQESDIYIECAPTGASDDETVVNKNDDDDGGGSDLDITAFLKSDTGMMILQILMATLLACAIIYVIHKLFAMTTASVGKMQGMLSP
jgi:carbonic anhydrase